MGQVHHGSATTTAAVRRAIQHSQESLRVLAKRYGINQKTVAKWRKRTSTADRKTGPTVPRSTVLSNEDEAVVVAFRRHTLLPLDDCLYALQATIPHLTRSSLHRCLQRHGISRLPEVEGDKPARAKFKRYPIGYFHIDIAEVHTGEGRLYLLVAIDRTSKFAFVELHEKATRRVAGNFLRALVAAVPYKIHTVLTDNGTHFTDPKGGAWTPEEIKALRAEDALFQAHAFELACADLDIEHRLTKTSTPLDERPGRAHEPDDQGGDGQTLPLRQPRPAPAAPRRLRRRLQLRPSAEDPTWSHALRSHLQNLDGTAVQVHP
jgi:transposase InsO family protein